MSCHDIKLDEKVLAKPNKILLMGNPNVGKSVFFTQLTGINAVSSNFSGTTVTFLEGKLSLGGMDYTLIDVPGTYSLAPTSEAEAVATRFMESGALVVICVLDASNLERNLRLALELRKFDVPVVYTLNLMDVASRRGITINAALLSQELGAPVVETVAVKKQGIAELCAQLEKVLSDGESCGASCGKCSSCPKSGTSDDSWLTAKEIARRVSKKSDEKPKFVDKLGDAMMKPWPGLPIMLGVFALLIVVVVFGGRMMRMPLIMLVDGAIVPFFRNIFESLFAWIASDGATLGYRYLFYDGGFQTGYRMLVDGSFQSVAYYTYNYYSGGFSSILLNVLIGEYGIFVISFQWIIALILPYVFAFYLAITFLEDSGYLPRISVLFDNLMRKLGVQGGSLIHMFLALGCAIPAIIGSRTATTKKERLMIATIICFAVPCISQIGALIALMGAFSWWMTPLMAMFAILFFIIVALLASKFIKGKVDPLILEVPNLLMPNPRAYLRKLAIRMKHFLKDAEVPMLAAVFIAAILAGTGVLNAIANQPQVQQFMTGWLGLPAEGVVSLILGIVRREMSVAPLLALNLTYIQAFVAGVVSLMYLPCLSVFGIVAKEFKIKTAIIIFIGTIVSALFIGGLVNQIANLF
ncbi:MAG: ferrous iron transporter B [Oscillospiraceae bacterium]|nr:ferrous iron transporter B [Oscillospiraceae bacterium]